MLVGEFGNSGEEEVLGGEILTSETVSGVAGGESEAVFGTGAAKDDALQAGATKESIFSDVGDLWQVDACQFPASDESSDSYIGDFWQVNACQGGAILEGSFSDSDGLWQVDTCQAGAIQESIFSDLGGL